MRLLFVVGIWAAAVAFAQPAITGARVYLNVSDIAAQEKFWTTHFDAAVISIENGPGIDLHGLRLVLHQQTPAAPSESGVIDHFGLKVRDLAAMLAELRAAGIPVQREFTGNEGFPNAYVIAPGQVKLELQQDSTLSTQSVAHHIHYYVMNPAEIQSWYVKMFAAQPRQRGALVTADLGGINLSFSQIREGGVRPATDGRALDHVGLETGDVARASRELDQRGVHFDSPLKLDRRRGVRSLLLRDPVNATLELFETAR